MNNKKRRSLAEDLAETLGVDLSAGNVTGFTVRAQVQKPVTVTVTHHLQHKPGIGVRQFTLQPLDRPVPTQPYDVNWACLTAQLRLQSFVDERARYHQKAMARSFFIRGQLEQFTTSLGDYLRAMLATEESLLKVAPLWAVGGIATLPRGEKLGC